VHARCVYVLRHVIRVCSDDFCVLLCVVLCVVRSERANAKVKNKS
jgi:hypothetical protein